MTKEEMRQIHKLYANDLYNYLLKLTHSEELAFDLLQDTFLRLFRYSKQEKKILPDIFRLRIDQNLTYQEIASILGIHKRTVFKNLEIIKKILIANFKKELDIDILEI